MLRPSRPSTRLIALACAAALGASPAANALECPQPPVQSNKDWDATVRAEVGKIGAVKGGELQTRVRTVTHGVIAKLPAADNVYLEQMMFSAYCSALRDDASLAESAKAERVLEYRRSLRTSLQAARP